MPSGYPGGTQDFYMGVKQAPEKLVNVQVAKVPLSFVDLPDGRRKDLPVVLYNGPAEIRLTGYRGTTPGRCDVATAQRCWSVVVPYHLDPEQFPAAEPTPRLVGWERRGAEETFEFDSEEAPLLVNLTNGQGTELRVILCKALQPNGLPMTYLDRRMWSPLVIMACFPEDLLTALCHA